MRLFEQGLLEIEHGNITQKYWMHSVIAAAIREQKKNILYDETRPFIERLSEELDFGSQWGQGYKKEYLIPLCEKFEYNGNYSRCKREKQICN